MIMFGAAALPAIWIEWSIAFPGSLPSPTGPHSVGRMEFDWVDESRADPLASPGSKRELDVFIWYPAEHAASGQRAVYLRPNWLRSLRRPFPSPNIGDVETHSWQDAPVQRPAGTGWPLVVLSSGFGATPQDYTFLAEDLASNGYAVAAPANTYAGPTVVFPDGRIARTGDNLPTIDILASIWTDDIRTVVNKLAELNGDSECPLAARVDLNRIGVIGHSFGGAASAQFCATREECRAGIDMDGALHGDALQLGTSKPFLFLSSGPAVPLQARLKGRAKLWQDSNRRFVAENEAFCRRSANCRVEIERGFQHMNYADAAVLFRPPLSWAHPAFGAVGGKRGLAIVRARVTGFLDRWLRG
jgi:dienelactone hydrolase